MTVLFDEPPKHRRLPLRRLAVAAAALACAWAIAIPGLAGAAPLSFGGHAQIGSNPPPDGQYLDAIGLMSPDGAFAYYSSDGCPARIIKVRLSDLTVVDETLTGNRATGQCYLTMAGAITSDGAFGYFGSNDGNPSLVKVRLSDMEIVGSIRVVDAGSVNRGGINQVILSADESTAYGFMNSGYILRVDLIGGTVTGSLTTPRPGLPSWLRVVQTPDRQHAYVTTADGAPARAGSAATVVKLDLAAFSLGTNLAIPNSTSLRATAWAISPDGAFLYYSLSPDSPTAGTPPKIVKIRTSDFSEAATVTLPARASGYSNEALKVSADGSTVWAGSTEPRLYQLDAATFQIVDQLSLASSVNCPNDCYPSSLLTGSRGGVPSLFIASWDNHIAQVVTGDAPPSSGGGSGGPGGGTSGDAGSSGAGGATAPTASQPVAETGAKATLRVSPPTRTGVAVRQRVTVGGPGRIVMTVSRITGGRSALCRVSVEVKKAGTQTVSCTLRRGARGALAKAPLRARVVTTFTPTGGTPTSSTSTINLG